MWKFQSVQGQTWDMLALSIYNSEKLAYVLLQANPDLMHYLYLPAGETVYAPQLPANKKLSGQLKPPWA